MSWLTSSAAFVYDFLADDGWEVLVGLVIVLPLVHFASEIADVWSGLVLIAGILLTVAVSLLRQLPRRPTRDA